MVDWFDCAFTLLNLMICNFVFGFDVILFVWWILGLVLFGGLL